MENSSAQKELDCLFCKIVQKKERAYIVWESDTHLAFLSIFPNTMGVTVVIPKKHYDSYAFELSDEALTDLVLATKKVANILDKKLDTISRTALVFEGFGVNHVHAKLYPLHGTGNLREWKPIKSSLRKYFDSYEGYISSHDGERATDASLEDVQKKITDQ